MKNRKRISVLLVLAMVMTMLAGLAAPAGAATTYSALTVPSVPTTTVAPVNLGTILINISALGAGAPHSAVFRLPTSVTLPPAMAVPGIVYSGPAFDTGESISATRLNAQEFRLDLTTAALRNDVRITMPILNVTTAAASGNITATITGLTGQLPSGSVVVGNALAGQVGLSMVSTPTMGLAGIPVSINISENLLGGLVTDIYNSLEFALPPGFAWSAASIINVATGAAPPAADGITVAPVVGDLRRLRVARTATTAGPLFLRVTATITPTEGVAVIGDVTASIGGFSTRDVTSLLVARYATFGVTVRRPAAVTTPPTIRAGFAAPAAGTALLEVVEATPSSLIAGGRNITLTLPAGLRFAIAPTAGMTGGLIVSSPATLSTDARTATFTVNTASNAPGGIVTVTFPAASIHVSPTAAAGDVTVTVAGSAGAAGTVVIATVRPVATVTAAAAPAVAYGVSGQAAADITITEEAAGRIATGNLVLTLPTGVSFSATPTVTRPTGNLTLSPAATLDAERRILTIPVATASTVASSIYISGIRYDVSRLAMDGPVNLTLSGAALVSGGDAPLTEVAAAFPADRLRIANATVGAAPPPAPTRTVFTIGALSFTRAGVTTPIDVAPTIVEGRTMLPLRFAALAVGVSEEDIIWDAARRTVTLLRGDRVVQLRIGDRTMTINGVVIPLDVPAAISNGRTVLPISAVARALRAGIVWDATARTVTVTAQ